jgi:hypothetical protein
LHDARRTAWRHAVRRAVCTALEHQNHEATDEMDRDKILLTPGPLTTTLRTKLAMLRDWGSWDADFIAITARVRARLLDIIEGHDTHVVAGQRHLQRRSGRGHRDAA